MLAAGDPAPGPMTVDGLTVAPVEIDLPVARFDLHLTIDLPVGTGGANDAVREAGQPDTDQTDTDQPGAGLYAVASPTPPTSSTTGPSPGSRNAAACAARAHHRTANTCARHRYRAG